MTGEPASLVGKVAIVTGAASGMGRAMALRFAAAGARVSLADVNDEGLAETLKGVEAAGGVGFAQSCDVARTADLARLVATTVDRFGRLDVAVANAGAVGGGDCFTLTEEQWERLFGINAKGTFFLFQAAARQMVQQGSGGRLIAVASMLATWATPSSPGYGASKAAVAHLVGTFAQACGPFRITVNGISPGFTETGMTANQDPTFSAHLVDRTPLGRAATADEMATVALFLAGDGASFVNGAVVPVDGGITLGLYSRGLMPPRPWPRA